MRTQGGRPRVGPGSRHPGAPRYPTTRGPLRPTPPAGARTTTATTAPRTTRTAGSEPRAGRRAIGRRRRSRAPSPGSPTRRRRDRAEPPPTTRRRPWRASEGSGRKTDCRGNGTLMGWSGQGRLGPDPCFPPLCPPHPRPPSPDRGVKSLKTCPDPSPGVSPSNLLVPSLTPRSSHLRPSPTPPVRVGSLSVASAGEWTCPLHLSCGRPVGAGPKGRT